MDQWSGLDLPLPTGFGAPWGGRPWPLELPVSSFESAGLPLDCGAWVCGDAAVPRLPKGCAFGAAIGITFFES